MLRSVYRPLGRWARRRFASLDRALTRAEVRPTLRAHPILIFSMGKTGTTSLNQTLHLATGREVVKAHALTRRGLDRRFGKSRRLAIVGRPRFLWTAEAIGDAVRRDDGRQWEIVCGVRDPIALAVSDHFYGLQLQSEVGVRPDRSTDDLDAHATGIAAGIDHLFVEEDWFADELETITSVDVYREPFPTRTGYCIYEAGRFRVLLTRFEDLPVVGPRALQTFFALSDPVEIPRRNVGTADDKGSLYHRFLREGSLPAEVIDRAYDTRLARHLYTDEERATFRAKWMGASV